MNRACGSCEQHAGIHAWCPDQYIQAEGGMANHLKFLHDLHSFLAAPRGRRNNPYIGGRGGDDYGELDQSGPPRGTWRTLDVKADHGIRLKVHK